MKKTLALFFLFLIYVCFQSHTLHADENTSQELTSKKLIYTFNIKMEIGPTIWRHTQKAIDEAHALNADLIFIYMDTYGGLVDAADSIRTKILKSKIPVYILIENNAASAGALISIACDSIYMMPGATIGAATVVDQSGNQVPDKYQSYMRKKMRATAEQKGRNPEIAEAMVDPDKVVPGVSDSGKVVTFSTNEAILHGFCEAQVGSMDEALLRSGITEYDLKKYEATWVDSAIGLLINPVVSGILIMIIIGGIYFELQTPGVGFPILAAAIASIFYFMPLYLEGMAENWEIILFFVGIILFAVEVFVLPGFGIAGIAGLTIMAALVLSLVQNTGLDFSGVDISQIFKALLTVILSIALSATFAIFFGFKFFDSALFSRFVLHAEQNKSEGYISTGITIELQFEGKEAITHTVLRPSGKVLIDNEEYDATSTEGFIEAGEKVIVERYENAQLFVSRI
jgi:membrane-bound serine protease (ClpP class)